VYTGSVVDAVKTKGVPSGIKHVRDSSAKTSNRQVRDFNIAHPS
jgi:hypothetical protein